MKSYKDKNLQVIFGVTLMAVIGVALIAPAFPVMAEVLGVSKAKIGLLITAFTLPGVFLAPIIGVLSDHYGRKKLTTASLLLFGFAGGACALVRDFNTLVLLRVIQGVGGAGLSSLATTLIGDLYEGPDRAEAMGYNASALSIGTSSYPLIGGALASIAWYYPFYLFFASIPVGLIVLLYLDNPEPKHELEMKSYFKKAMASMLNKKTAGAFGAGIFTFILLYGGYLTYFPIYFADTFYNDPKVIGILLSTMSITTVIVSSQTGRISNHISNTLAIKLAFLFYGIGLVLIPVMPSPLLLIIPTLFFGAGMGLNIPALMTLVAGLAPMEQRGVVMSINATMLRVGQTLGPAVGALAFLYLGINAVFYTFGAFAITASILAIGYGFVKIN